MSAPTALPVGYNSANNTAALLQADIADLRAVLGPDARLTVPTGGWVQVASSLTAPRYAPDHSDPGPGQDADARGWRPVRARASA
jgi:hypothetical protein